MHIAWSIRAIAQSVPPALAAALLVAGCGSDFTLSSPDIPSGGTIGTAQVASANLGCSGTNISPALNWANPPSGTQSFAITMYDGDAPTGSGFWHWAVYNIPASARSIPQNAGNPTIVGTALLPAGSVQGYIDYGMTGYGGPCPPAGDTPHHYLFTVYALKVADLGLPSTSTGPPGALVSFQAKANSIASASFTATYGIAGPPTSHPPVPTAAGFTLASAEIPSGGTIPLEQVAGQAAGCNGGNVSPSVQWSGAPAGTKSFVLQIYDPDAPTGSGFWHWSVFNIPFAASGSIPKSAGNGGGGCCGGATQGISDYGTSGYGGPCPPAGNAPHHYQFTLYALKVANLPLTGGATGALVGFMTRANATAQANFTATYGR